ncbi:MAG TPA: CRISPR-associated protein Csx16 [Burkholderiaceae bacterium]|jgi:CRISPR-associated protein Csx16|nr:CRISPR-associated protein Csx16 [Burkholderiaceae bacterium]
MTIWFVSRHPGAAAWARRQGLSVDRMVEHLDVAAMQPGDTVIGTLPVHLAAAVCERGARLLHLALDLPPALRGRELSAEELAACGARLEQYRVERVAPTTGEDASKLAK